MKVKRYPKLSSASYRRIYSRVPRVCVDVLIRKSGGVLLSRRSIQPYLGSWHLPGGRVRLHETFAHTAKRICREELGLRVRVLTVLGAIEYLRERQVSSSMTHSVSVVLSAESIGGTPRGSWQAREISFFRSLPRKIIPEVRTFLLANKFIRRH